MLDIAGLDWASVEAEAERSLAESLAGWQERYPDVVVHRLVVPVTGRRDNSSKSRNPRSLSSWVVTAEVA